MTTLIPKRIALLGAIVAAAAVLLACAASQAKTVTRTVTVKISGGHGTDPQDHGRPVVLVAAGLGVPTEVFREAFRGVTPAGQGSGGPTEAEAQRNKAALLSVLAPYGVTNEELDRVSNYYRYNASAGEVWRQRAASAKATIRNGKVVSIAIADGGAGYSSTPTVTVPGYPKARITATVSYGKDLATNGAVTALKVAS
jgi:hypothetical protein